MTISEWTEFATGSATPGFYLNNVSTKIAQYLSAKNASRLGEI